MKLLDLKLRMMLLWIWIPIGMTASLLSFIFTPGGLEQIVTDMQASGFVNSVYGIVIWLVPLVMALLSLTLKDRANRITNRVLSIIYAAFLLFMLSSWFFEPTEPTVLPILFECITVAAAVYLIFYSWKWPVK